ncbi:MAG: M56 family metallopeptidase [Lentimicrobiaceae bacterium]|nr:M56 family metallopeptidase [Lentimicrobiaceae bacterium]
MSAFILYLLKSAICLAVFYPFYRLLLNKETFYHFNRFILLALLVLSAIIPFVSFPVWENDAIVMPIQKIGTVISEQILSTKGLLLFQEPETATSSFGIISVIYLLGVAVQLLLFIFSCIKVFSIIRRSQRIKFGKQLLAITSQDVIPFSFIRYIVISKSDYQQYPNEILCHEKTHLTEFHYIDLLASELFVMLQWFNPVAWFIRKNIRMVHEFEADHNVIKQGIDTTKYQLLLVKKAVGASRFTLANSFNHSNIKKRITMIKKQRSNRWARLKALFFLPLAALMMQAFAFPEIKQGIEQIANNKITQDFQKPKKNSSVAFLTSGKGIPGLDTTYCNHIMDSLNQTGLMVNGQVVKLMEASEIIKEKITTTDSKIRPAIAFCIASKSNKDLTHQSFLNLPAINPKNPEVFYVLNGKWIYGRYFNTDNIDNVWVISGEDAVKKYGRKAKNGAIVVTTKNGVKH